MSFQEKIKSLFFVISLIFAGLFSISPVFANTVEYVPFYSSDNKFRIESSYYDANDSNRAWFEFKLLDTSSKTQMYIQTGQGGGGNPQILFGTNSGTIFNQNHGNVSVFTGWLCIGTTETFLGNPAYKVLRGQSIFCTPRWINYIGYHNYTNGATKSDIESLGYYLNNPAFMKEIYSPFYSVSQDQDYYGFTDIPNSSYHALDFGFTSIPPVINGECGTAEGQLFSEAPTENLCAVGPVIYGPLLQSGLWYWECGGQYGGVPDTCTAFYGVPEAPPEEDCEGLTGVEYFTCKISNILTGLFFPSQEKITELNQAMQGLENKAPFNYLEATKDAFSNFTVSTETLSMTFFGASGTIDAGIISILAEPIRLGISWIFLFGFLVWALNYIKHFF